jgi:hypothetical protein
VVVVRRRLVEWSPHWRNVDVNNFLSIGVENRAKVERVTVLTVIHMWAVVHEGLLETNIGSESLVVANCPCYVRSVSITPAMISALTITIDFVHILRGDSNDTTLLNHFWIFSNDRLHDLEVFHGDLLTINTTRGVADI